ncbi:MAG: methyltransferase domain-containing protein [Pseudomonadota bacterium]
MADVHLDVQDYYGKVLQTTEDLMTNACTTSSAMPRYIKSAISNVHEEVIAKYYGCGLTLPLRLEAARILDLGSGAGRDCYIASQLVGQEGQVVGVDMTKEQLLTARKHIDFHMDRFGYSKKNVEFHEGYLEDLSKLNLKAASFDVVVSNCVLNLVKDKRAVLEACFGLLKEGGELYFSDVYASRRIPEVLAQDKVLYGECLSGALYWNDFEHMAKRAGFYDPRVVSSSPITVQNENAIEKLGDIKFHSITYRLFKLKDLEPDCEDFGQAVRYLGNIQHSEKGMFLDAHHYFEKGKIKAVCGNTWNMLFQTRFKEHFDFIGNFETHYGIFEGCGKNPPFTQNASNEGAPALSCC